MKKLYKQFNKRPADIKTQPMETDELEIKRVTEQVLRRSRKRHAGWKLSGAAALFLSAGLTAASVAYPAFAAQLPIVGSLFEHFTDQKGYVLKDPGLVATPVNQTKESNGITVTVTDAVYDRENIVIAYTLRSDKDLGSRPGLLGSLAADEFTDQQMESGFPERFLMQKTGDGEYAGLYIVQLMDGKKPDSLHLTYSADSVRDFDNGTNAHAGDWTFTFSLTGLDTKPYELSDARTAADGMQIRLTQMMETPLSTTFYLTEIVDVQKIAGEEDEWRAVLIDYDIQDNFGNAYNTMQVSDSAHNTDFIRHGYHGKPRITTAAIHEDATVLLITPTVRIYEKEGTGDGSPMHEVGEPFTIDPIEVPLQR